MCIGAPAPAPLGKQLLFLDRDHASLNKKVRTRLRGVTDLLAVGRVLGLESDVNHVIYKAVAVKKNGKAKMFK